MIEIGGHLMAPLEILQFEHAPIYWARIDYTLLILSICNKKLNLIKALATAGINVF